MFTNASKHFLGLFAVAALAAVTFHLGDVALGEINKVNEVDEAFDAIWASVLEWKTGDLFGVVLLAFVATGAAFAAGLVLATRDQAEPVAERLETPAPSASYWPLATALGTGIMVTGLVINTQLAMLGMAVLVVAFVEWAATTWADRISTDEALNSAARSRILAPMEVPVFGAALIGIPVLAVSRVLLASSVNGAVVVAGVIGVLILAVASVIYAKPEASKHVLRGVVIVTALGVIVGGVVGAAVGERDFERHVGGGDHAETQTSHDEGS